MVRKLGMHQSDARCAEFLLGRFTDETAGSSLHAWAIVYSKFGRMVDGSYRTDYPPGFVPRPVPEINYEGAVVFDATNGRHVTANAAAARDTTRSRFTTLSMCGGLGLLVIGLLRGGRHLMVRNRSGRAADRLALLWTISELTWNPESES